MSTQPEVQPEVPRISRLSGKEIHPVTKRTPVEIKVTLLPREGDGMDDDSTGLVARRAVPREAAPVAKPSSAAVDALIAGTKADPNEDARRLTEAKALLKPVVDLAKSIIADVEAFAAEQREYLLQVRQINFSRYLALSRNNDRMAQRLNTIEHRVEESLRTINNVPVVLGDIPKKVASLHVADLRLTVGRDADNTVQIGVDAIRRTVQGMAAIRQRLDESLDLIKRLVEELHQQSEANGWLKPTPEGTTFTDVVTPEEQRRREALRPSPVLSRADNGGPPGNESDWNPLDYTPGGRN